MAKWIAALLPALLVAASLPAHAQAQPSARAGESIAGKAAAAKATPAKPAATTSAAQRKPLQATTGAVTPAAVAAPSSTGPLASPAGPAALKDKSHCHSSGSDA